MRILSVRRGFTADHSSTSYEFLAVDKPLNSKARAEVSKLSSRVHPTGRRAYFIYHAEGYDIPGGWGGLMAKYYDVMYSESYDWWTLVLAFNTANKDLAAKIKKYEFQGIEDLGVDVSYRNKRLVVTIHCRMDMNYLYQDHEDFEDDYCEESGSSVATNDTLLNLLVSVRDRLKKGDYQSLYAVWEKYGLEEEEGPPRPRRTKTGAPVEKALSQILDTM